MKNTIIVLSTALLFLISTGVSMAQQSDTKTKKEKDKEIVFLAGLIQPLVLQGGNFEVDFYTKRMVFNYSHGFSLELNSEGNTVSGDLADQQLAVHLPYSTGFGIGYRLNKYFDIRFEPKFHRFEVYYDGTDRTVESNQVVNYNTVTLGAGAYFRWKPFEQLDNPILNGIFTSTSVRYWQNVSNSLEGGELEYFNTATDQVEVHEASNIGLNHTPWLVNVAVGYAIKF